jgi:hypothetical protein
MDFMGYLYIRGPRADFCSLVVNTRQAARHMRRVDGPLLPWARCAIAPRAQRYRSFFFYQTRKARAFLSHTPLYMAFIFYSGYLIRPASRYMRSTSAGSRPRTLERLIYYYFCFCARGPVYFCPQLSRPLEQPNTIQHI